MSYMTKMKKMPLKRKNELAARLAQIESEVKGLREKLGQIKKRARSAIEKAITSRDTRKLEELRKQLGLK